MKRFVVVKLIGLSLLTMITLVIISILEVTVYSYVVHPGQDPSFYESHANLSAPYISGIFGFIVFFLVARHWKKMAYENAAKLVMLFPLTYVLMDAVLITAVGMVQWSSFILIFALANGAKFLGSLAGYKLSSSRVAAQ